MRFSPKTVFGLFFVSGFTALVFEVVWARQALLIFGNTTLANAAVIAAFMTGLALGSYFFGKLADRHPTSALRLYGSLEGGVGLFALFFPILVGLLFPVYKAIYLRFYQDFFQLSVIRFALSFLVLMIPTTLMGGTMPVLSRFLVVSSSTLQERVSKLYAMNLFGAMTGSFASGFFLISALGLQKSAVLAAVLNIGIFVFIFTRTKGKAAAQVSDVSQPAAPAETSSSVETARSLNGRALVLLTALMLVHGLCAFTIQISWSRIIALILGSSTYAFSAMLTTFLAGLGLGTYAVSVLVKRGVKLSLAKIGFMEIAAGASVLLFIPIFEWLIYFFVRLFPFIQKSIFWVFVTQFLFSAAAMIIPTFLIGLIFPAVLAYLGRLKDIGRIVGTTYAVNTFGGVLGCLLGAFYFITNFGLNGTLRLAGFLSMAIGVIVVLFGSDPSRRKANLVKAAFSVCVAGLFFFYPWDKNMFSSGVFIYADSWKDRASLGKAMFQRSLKESSDLIFYKDGISSTVSVLQYEGRGGKLPFKAKSLRVNGKTDASTVGDMATQLYLGYIPLFAHARPENVLIIGLGAGVTVGAVTQFPSVKDIECVEIEPAVVEANRFFTAENNFALRDPRVEVIIGDGRNHISFSPKKYDVIISEPSNPWMSGVSNLFSLENYELALQKLNPDGIYCQWFHAYQMSLRDFQMIIHTFASVFPEVNLFRVGTNDYFLLGSREPISFDYAKMMSLIDSNKYIQTDLSFFTDHEEHFVMGSFLLSNDDLRSALRGKEIPLNLDDHLILEYNAPKHLYERSGLPVFEWLQSIPRKDVLPKFYHWDEKKMLAEADIWKIYFKNGVDALLGRNYGAARDFLEKAYDSNPAETKIQFYIGQAYEGLKQYDEAIKRYSALKDETEWQRRIESAVERARLRQRMDANPILNRNALLHNLIGSLSFFMGDYREMVRSLELAIDIDPTFIDNYANLATYYFLMGNEEDGEAVLKKAARIDPKHPSLARVRQLRVLLTRDKSVEKNLQKARLYLLSKDYRQAKRYLEEVVEADSENLMAYSMLAKAEMELGMISEAEVHQAKAIALMEAAQQKKTSESSAENGTQVKTEEGEGEA